jgi:tetratricopeptide (TPR) repeat protein/tRNA A-37 threonylcarbamoyl transferase component Bud32
VLTGVLTPPPSEAPTATAASIPPHLLDADDDTTALPRPPGVPFTEPPTASSQPTSATAATEATTDAITSSTTATALPSTPAPPRPQTPRSERGPFKPGEAFGRYHIIRLLGIGGMGAVYQAWDEELGVAVAIKVIRPEVMADPEAAQQIERRFKRELLLARQVTHKNVVRIHDLGELSGMKYITMSYVNGIDLATLLKQEGKLDVPRVMRIIRPLVSGLVAAHAGGVVHRDLKPANVMFGINGDAFIMDFGIARSISAGAEADPSAAGLPANLKATVVDAGTTMAGSILGTVQYMAPEQAQGLEVDHRADIYAFGLIVYDMLVGRRRAEQAESAIAELKGRMKQAPASVRSVIPEVPAGLDQLIATCLEPDPVKRFKTTEELAAALNRLDDMGEVIPIRRVVGMPLLVAVGLLGLVLTAGTWWYTRNLLPPPEHEPVSVVIADLTNTTSDTTFDRSLEPMLKLALEGAGFISAYSRSDLPRALAVQPPATLDEAAAREIAVKQGLGVVVSGSVSRAGRGNSYNLTLKATQPVTGDVIVSVDDTASSKDQVLGVATAMANEVREALGDETTSDSSQRFAQEALSAVSLDVVRDYAAAMGSLSNSQFNDARDGFKRAVERDPNFGLAYAGMAIASRNMGEQQEAEKYIAEAVRHVDRMTERERFRTRGIFYMISNDYQACGKEFGDLIAKYAADVAARNNLAICSTGMRDMNRAYEEMKRAVEILPKRGLYRVNLALYASYRSDFQTGLQEAKTATSMSPLGLLPLAFAEQGLGQLMQAAETYSQLEKVDPSYTSSGIGDIAIYEGRFTEAVRVLTAGAQADVMAKKVDRAATKYAAIAQVQLLRRQRPAAVAAAERALMYSSAAKIRFLAARVFVEAGDVKRAQTIAVALGKELQAEPQAYAKVIEGQIALRMDDPRTAVTALTAANQLLDTWLGRLELGRAYLAANAFTQADSEFDRCINRRGELFLDEEPMFGLLPQVYYLRGMARQGLKSAGFAVSYRTFV